MENENDSKNQETNTPAPHSDPGADIETVTPSTEELIPDTPEVNKEEKEAIKQSSEPEGEGSEERDDDTDMNNIETVAP